MPEEQVTPAEVQEEIAAPSTEVQNESTESATGEEQQEPQGEGEGHKSKGGFQRRIDKLTREKADKERELEYWRQQALRTQPEKPAEVQKTEDKPARENFASDTDFVEALTDWKLDQRQAKQAQENEKKAAVQPLFEAREKFAATVDDYHEVMRAATDVPVTPSMLPYLQDPEIGPELGYFLATNPDEAKKFAKLGPVALAKAVVDLQPRFKPDAPSQKTATVSKAPPPPSSSGKSLGRVDKDPSEMSAAEWMEYRAKKYPGL